MEDGVDTPLGWKFKLYGNWGDNFDNFEGAMPSWC
jgi:hypothetical protein